MGLDQIIGDLAMISITVLSARGIYSELQEQGVSEGLRMLSEVVTKEQFKGIVDKSLEIYEGRSLLYKFFNPGYYIPLMKAQINNRF
tara:strand:+ start:8899 stop:9159 length:261 start_codon:yes stop_codon:yes gene_type:complete